jgi:hypothetical protein
LQWIEIVTSFSENSLEIVRKELVGAKRSLRVRDWPDCVGASGLDQNAASIDQRTIRSFFMSKRATLFSR